MAARCARAAAADRIHSNACVLIPLAIQNLLAGGTERLFNFGWPIDAIAKMRMSTRRRLLSTRVRAEALEAFLPWIYTPRAHADGFVG